MFRSIRRMGALTLLTAGIVLVLAVPMAGAQTIPPPPTTSQSGYGPTTAPGGQVGGETQTQGPGGGVSGIGTQRGSGGGGGGHGGFLAFTGANAWPLTLFGGLAVLVGGLLALGSRQRSHSRS